MQRREFISLIGATAAFPVAAVAQQAGNVYRVGYLSTATRESAPQVLDGLLRKLNELGWIVGKNLVFEYRWAEGDATRLLDLASDLVRRNVDLIVASTGAAAIAAKNATGTIPIVMIFPGDPVALGLVASLSQPGANVTGTSNAAGPGISGKRLEILKQAIPRLAHVAILGNPADQSLGPPMKELDTAAEALGIRLERFDVQGPGQFDGIFADMTSQRVDAVLVVANSTNLPYRAKLAELALQARLPTMTNLREFSEAGCLLSYGVNQADFVARAALYVDRILKGARPADLAVEQPTKFELLINLRTAKALGVTIPDALLASADEIIE